MFCVKCWVHIFCGSFGSFGSVVDKKTRNNLYDVMCWVHIFSGSFGSSGSAVGQRTKYKLFSLSVGSYIERFVWLSWLGSGCKNEK